MKPIKYTLIGDGSSDEALLNIIKWSINDLYPQLPTGGTFADFRKLPNPPSKANIQEQINFAEQYYPFDLLFYHRDAESNKNGILEDRKKEILSSLNKEQSNKIICIIPIVMMETWLLIDIEAIKKGSGNRNYTKQITLPKINKLESCKDPKKFLHDLLKEVSGLKKRKLKSFNANKAVHHVSEYITNFKNLRSLHSFEIFEKDLKDAINKIS